MADMNVEVFEVTQTGQQVQADLNRANGSEQVANKKSAYSTDVNGYYNSVRANALINSVSMAPYVADRISNVFMNIIGDDLYTAPENGWIYVYSDATNVRVHLNSILTLYGGILGSSGETGSSQGTTGNGISLSLAVSAGDICRVRKQSVTASFVSYFIPVQEVL